MMILILFTAKFSAKRGVHTVGRIELFTAEFSAKQGDYMVTVLLPLNFQPNESMTIGHSSILYR